MRAIIIQDLDAKALLDKLKLEKFLDCGHTVPDNIDPAAWRVAMQAAIHRRFHYVVTNWLQEQGANLT